VNDGLMCITAVGTLNAKGYILDVGLEQKVPIKNVRVLQKQELWGSKNCVIRHSHYRMHLTHVKYAKSQLFLYPIMLHGGVEFQLHLF
jgi:hypothetical protein